MQVKAKHKYRGPTTKGNSFSPAAQGCSCVVKRPRTLPIRNDTHCIDTSFGNLTPSCRCLAFFSREYYFEGSGTGKLVSVDKYAIEISINSGKSEKKGIPQKYYLFSENIPPG